MAGIKQYLEIHSAALSLRNKKNEIIASNIANAASDLVVNTQGAGFSLVYSGDATTGWSYREK